VYSHFPGGKPLRNPRPTRKSTLHFQHLCGNAKKILDIKICLFLDVKNLAQASSPAGVNRFLAVELPTPRKNFRCSGFERHCIAGGFANQATTLVA